MSVIFFNKLKGYCTTIPSQIAGRVASYLHQKLHTSKNRKVPSDISVEGILHFLERAEVKQGDILFVHSSWGNLNSGKFDAQELINSLLSYLGSEGTLAMPAIPNIPHVNGALFKLKRTPSAAGLLTEVFRRYPDVKRSINLNHSVCALGPQANFLMKDHHHSETSWDDMSPYYKLGQFENAWIVGLGVGHRLKVATSLHCVESKLWKNNAYFNKLFKKQICYNYVDELGNEGQHCYKQRSGQIYTPKIAKYFSRDELREETVDGLEVYAVRAKVLIERSVALGVQGKTMYVWPIPWPWLFK